MIELKRKERSFDETPKVYVSWDGKTGVRRVLSVLPLTDNVPALVFPPELAEMHSSWYVTNNPDGVPVLFSNNQWSVYACRMTDGEVRFFLKDRHGEIEEIPWLQPNEAIYDNDWPDHRQKFEEYDQDIAAFRHDLNKIEHLCLTNNKAGKINKKTLKAALSFKEKWLAEFPEQQEQRSVDRSHLMVGRSKLEKARDELVGFRRSVETQVDFSRILGDFFRKLEDFKSLYESRFSAQFISSDVHDKAAKVHDTWLEEMNKLKIRATDITDFSQALRSVQDAIRVLAAEWTKVEKADIPTSVIRNP